MTDRTQETAPPTQRAGSSTAGSPYRGSATSAPAVKPTGPMTYIVEKGANIVPSWLTNGRSATVK